MASVTGLGPDHPIRRAHQASLANRTTLEKSVKCGCFHCLNTYSPAAVTRWLDADEPDHRQTALCPFCGIDSVIGDASGFALTPEFLFEMNLWWFGGVEEQ